MPTGGKVTPLLLGWASAVCLGAELECVALAFAVDLGDDVDEAEADPVLEAEEAVLWVAVPDAAPVVEVLSSTIPRTRLAAVPASRAR